VFDNNKKCVNTKNIDRELFKEVI